MPKITIERRGIGAAPGTPGKIVVHAGVAEKRRSVARAIAFLVLSLSFAASSYGQESLLARQTPEVGEARLTVHDSAPTLALGKYLASLQERNLFTESGPVGVEIQASLPGLAKEGRMLAVRRTGASERSEYDVIRFDGLRSPLKKSGTPGKIPTCDLLLRRQGVKSVCVLGRIGSPSADTLYGQVSITVAVVGAPPGLA